MWSTNPNALIPTGADLERMISSAEQKLAASRKAALEDRAAQAKAINAKVMQADRDAYLNQMPRARGYRT